MKIRSLHLEQFKKFDQPVRIDGFSDGLNLIAGPNEMGKSTLLLALRAALFERHGSKAQSIKALQPNHVQGAAPWVSVEFEIDQGVYRIEKRFLRRPIARFTRPDGQVVEGNEAETAIQKTLKLEREYPLSLDKGSPGHFGVMLIPQSQSFHQPSLPDGTRHVLQAAITAEIEQLGNQSEVDAVLANVDMATFEIVDKRAKPKGRYKDVEARLGEVESEIEVLRLDREELADDISSLNEAEKRLRSLESDDADQDLLAKLEDLEGQRVELARRKEIDANIANARYRVDRLVMTRDQRQKRQAEQARLAVELDRLNRKEQAARARLAELEAELREQQTKRQSLNKADDAIRQKRQSFERLNTQLNQRAEIENALRAMATEVTIDLDSGALDRVRLDGRPSARSTEVIDVVDGLEIEIQDVGRIKVLPKVDELERLRNHRAALDQSITSLIDTLALESTEPEQVEVFWRETEEEAATLEINRAELEPILSGLEPLIAEEKSAALIVTTKRQQVEERRAVVNAEIKADDDGPDQNEDQLSTALANAEADLVAAYQATKNLIRINQPAPVASLDELEVGIKDLRLRLDERGKKISEAKVTIGRLGAKVAVRAGRGLDERLEERLRRREILGREQQRYQLNAKALNLLKNTLTEAANDAKAHFHAPLAARLTPYIQSLLPEAEPEVTPDFGIAALHRGNPVSEQFEQLSDGTREQIAILARLAFAQMLKEQGLPALVVLDDALVFSDQKRLAVMFNILKKAAATLQIIVLTCREDRFADLHATHLSIEHVADAA